MAIHRPEISNATKKKLVAQAGHKCANPGCSNRRSHIHHIREWAVYRTHDEIHMIAVCPACHDAIHFGALPLDDAVLYEWKSIPRPTGPIQSHIYIEPGGTSKLLLGTIAVATPLSAIVFELSSRNSLRFSIKDDDILLLEASVSDTKGDPVVRVVDNYVKHPPRSDVEYRQIPGTISLTTTASDAFLPSWAHDQMRSREPSFALNSEITLLQISVVKPGLVRVEGVWAEPDNCIVITKATLSFLRRERQQPLSLVGDGEGSVLFYAPSGVVSHALFGFDEGASLGV